MNLNPFNQEDKVLSIIVLLMWLWFIFGIFYFSMSYLFYSDVKINACREIGFEDYKFRNGESFCVENNNYHYVEMECSQILRWKGCEATEISIGEVFIRDE